MFANKPSPSRAQGLCRLALVIAVAGLLAACQHGQQTLASLPYVGDKFTTAILPVGPLPPPPERKWPDAQQDVLAQQARGYGLARMPELQVYLNGLFVRVKGAAGVPDWPGSVYLLATSNLEAYSTAAGNVFLSPSWVTSAESEDELVALLSHEFAHIYLHYHQLAGFVESTDQTSQIAALGLAIVKSKAMGNGWTPVDSLLIGYGAGRDLAVGYYGRSEEIAADNFGLNVSLKLGYSYNDGIKAFLERIASWEESHAKRRQVQKEQLRAAFQQQVKAQGEKNRTTGKAADASLQAPVTDLNTGIATAFYDLTVGINDGIELATAKHPDINARIERQASASEKLPDAIVGRDPVIRPLVAARKRPATATALKNYQLAAEVLNDVALPNVLNKARKAASGPTANHAMPLLALYWAQQAAMKTSPTRLAKQSDDPGKVLELNFNSPADRAWRTYIERSQEFQGRGNIAAAKKTLDAGLVIFRKTPDAWPPAIQFYGQTQGWPMAKAMANECIKENKSFERECRAAAVSPAEQAEAERKSKEKADQIAKKILKTGS